MAENEVKKEKQPVKMSIWFVIFIVYFILSIALIVNQARQIQTLNYEVATLNSKLELTVAESNERSAIILRELNAIVKKYSVADSTTPEVVVPEVTVGTYTGNQATIVLSENNIATLTIADNTLLGTYSVAGTVLTFTSDDGLTIHTLTILEDGNLKFLNGDVEVTLSK